MQAEQSSTVGEVEPSAASSSIADNYSQVQAEQSCTITNGGEVISAASSSKASSSIAGGGGGVRELQAELAACTAGLRLSLSYSIAHSELSSNQS